MSGLAELADECKRASGNADYDAGLGRLNADVLRALGWRSADGDVINPAGDLVFQVPFVVGSIDAAMTLVPEGAGINIDRYWNREGARWKCEISTGGVPNNPRQVFDCWDARTAALAVCAAALRARAGQTEDASHG